MQTAVEEVKSIFPHVEMPTGKPFYIARFKDTPVKEFKDYKGKGFVANLGHKQQLLLGQMISEQVGQGQHYTLLSLQQAYDLVHSKTQKGRDFKEKNQTYWFHDIEAIKKVSKVMEIFSEPKVVEKQGELVYDGKSKKVKINKDDDVVETLENAGLFKEGEHKIYHGSMTFDDNGESSVGSHWNRGEDCFNANSYGPSYRHVGGLAAFRLLGQENELVKSSGPVQVEESRLAELEATEQKYNSLSEDFKRLEADFERMKKRF